MDEYRDFTYSKAHFADLPHYINETKERHNLRWTLILDPAIQADKGQSYSVFAEGYRRDVFIKWPKELAANSSAIGHPRNAPADKGVLYGKVWPNGPAAFPDFFKNSTVYWWKEMIKSLHGDLKFDALWIVGALSVIKKSCVPLMTPALISLIFQGHERAEQL